MTAEEKAAILAHLGDEHLADFSVSQVFYRLLDEGIYIASEASWHRVARSRNLTGDRRPHATHPAKVVPELHATGPNQVWSWDITVLPSIDRGRNFKLYVILDVFSRFIVGWRIEDCERGFMAVEMLTTAINNNTVPAVLHADRGSPMTGEEMTAALDAFGIIQSHSRPHVSNDNPFSESQFRTMKYDLDYPRKFRSIEHAREWMTGWAEAYNTQHRHSGIGHYTPESVHDGTWTTFHNRRQAALDDAYQRNPIRYTRKPHAEVVHLDSWINNPAKRQTPPELSQTG